MSKTVVIQRSGTSTTQNTISEIETSGAGHGSVTWVPESEVDCGAITIKHNGTFKAKDKGYYAFSKVKVESDGKAYGKKNGKKVVAKPDGNGFITYTECPERISIITLPTKTVYQRGEPIDLTGIRVVALYKDGTIYAEVPVSALRKSPTTATKSKIEIMWDFKDDDDILETHKTYFYITIGA